VNVPLLKARIALIRASMVFGLRDDFTKAEIRFLRESTGLSSEGLAERLCIEPQSVYSICTIRNRFITKKRRVYFVKQLLDIVREIHGI